MKAPVLFQGGIITKYSKNTLKKLKNLLFRTAGPISTKFGAKRPWVHRQNPRLITLGSSISPSPMGDHVNIGRMIIIKDNLIGNSWGNMSIFVQSERSFQRTFVSIFKMATMNYLVSCCKSEVVVMLPFLQKSFVFNTIDLIGQYN